MLAESSSNSPAPTKVVHPDMSHCSESISRHNHRVPSQTRRLQPAPLGCFCVSHWAPRFLSTDVGVESLALGVADSPHYFEAFLFCLRAAIVYSVGCVVFVIGALCSDFHAGILCAWCDLRRVFGGTLTGTKRPRLNRISTFTLVALYLAAAPWCATGQVGNHEICEFKVEQYCRTH
jgi:hypothetical protein